MEKTTSGYMHVDWSVFKPQNYYYPGWTYPYGDGFYDYDYMRPYCPICNPRCPCCGRRLYPGFHYGDPPCKNKTTFASTSTDETTCKCDPEKDLENQQED